jgi:hypothetical protein
MAAGIVRVPGTASRPGRVHFLRRAISLGKSVRVYRLKMQICSVAKKSKIKATPATFPQKNSHPY